MIDNRRFRSLRSVLAALLGLLWAISVGAVRDFVWADLREGVISLRGLSWATRGLVILGFTMLAGGLFLLLTSDLWRARFELTSSIVETPGRGSLAPRPLLPVSIFVLAVAWSFALCAARYSGVLVRGALLGLYLLTALAWLNKLNEPDTLTFLLGWGSLLATIVLILLPRRLLSQADIAFVPILLAVGTLFAVAQRSLLLSDRLSGLPIGQASLEGNVQTWSTLVLPLLFLIGIDIANFTRQASGWTTAIIRERLPRFVLYVALPVAAGWLATTYVDSLHMQMAVTPWPEIARGFLGAAAIPLLTVLWWWLVTRRHGSDLPSPNVDDVAVAAVRWGPLLVTTYLLPLLLISVLSELLQVIGIGGIQAGGAFKVAVERYLAQSLALIGVAGDRSDVWNAAVSFVLVFLALELSRRTQKAAALYLGLVGLLGLWNFATRPGALFGWLTWERDDVVNAWWMVCVLAIALFWMARRTLQPARAGALLFLLFILLLLRQTDFIENPFSPFFAFAGVGFIAFGIAWDALTVGTWANRDTRRLPRTSRIFLYLAYVLITVTLVNWALGTHDLETLGRYTGDAALAGLGAFGKPLLYLLFPICLSAGLPGAQD